MHINAVCPACENSYMVTPSLRGKAMRCPNPECRTVFTVGAELPPEQTPTRLAPPPSPSPGNGQQTGSVGDMVPILSAETEVAPPRPETPPSSKQVGDMVPLVEAKAAEPAAPAAKAAPSWQAPPPVRRPTNPTAPARPAPELNPAPPVEPPPPAAKEQPREMPAGSWEAPPVRRGKPAEPMTSSEPKVKAAPEPAPGDTAAPEEEYIAPPSRARRIRRLMTVAIVLAALLLGGGGVTVWWILTHSEDALFVDAEKQYAAKHFAEAADSYRLLVEKFPTSDKRDLYKMMRDLSEWRRQAGDAEPDISKTMQDLDQFLDDNKNQPSLKDRAPDLADTVVALAEGYVVRNPNPPDEEGPPKVMERLQRGFDAVKALEPTPPLSPGLQERLAAATHTIQQLVLQHRQLRESVERLTAAATTRPGSLAVRKFLGQLKQEQMNLPDIDKRPEVVELRKQVYAKHLKGVQNETSFNPERPDPEGKQGENNDTSLVVVPMLRGTAVAAPKDDPTVLALARGVLYGLKRGNGQKKWTVRVGVDTTALPVRVPQTEANPELILVLSADAATVTALDADGQAQWQYQLDKPCVGRPLVVNNLAYLPTYGGLVHEIELARGKALHVYDLGQPLTQGGARDPVTNLLYFPGDDFCVYVIDPEQHRCTDVLYTYHPAGSLRGEPMIFVAPDAEGNDAEWLVLNLAYGLNATRLRVYHLPIGDREQPPEALDPEPEAPGWTWFPPFHDDEKVAMLGDKGILELFGIRQTRNLNDPLLFPMTPRDFPLGSATASKGRGRSEVVEVDDRDYWVLADGELKQWRRDLNAAAGPQMTPVAEWTTRALGSPLHASQMAYDPARGHMTLVLVTQPLRQQTCLATAVDDGRGDVLWQRQLGLVCQGEPLELRPAKAGGSPVLLVLDQGGGLFKFEPGGPPDSDQSLYPALDDGPGAPPTLLPGPDGQSAYEIACPGDGQELKIRHVVLDPASGQVKTDPERSVPLSSPLAGKPAVTASMMVLPLANGVLARMALPLAEQPRLTLGPNWRSNKAPPDAPARLTALDADDFLACDGGRGVTHWLWSDKEWKQLPPERDGDRAPGEVKRPPTLQRKEGSLTADPILLPEVKDAPRQACIADVGGAVTLLTVTAEGGLKEGRSWKLGGQITAGPYVQVLPDGATRIACVVNKNQLAWLDPADGTMRKYPEKPGAALVGRPRLVGGLLVIADESGLIVGLDTEKDLAAGPKYQLGGSAAPAASPIGYGDDRLFVPLTDGTILLPKLERIR